MNIYGREYGREELLKYCNTDVLYGARRVELSDGRGRGHRLVEVKTSAGLRASFSEDRCLDIVDLEYKGVNLAFLTKNGIVEKPAPSPETDSFTKYWAGGFMNTCGLRNVGPSCEVDGEFFPLHGRIGVTPADNVNVSADEKEITITGKVRESALFGHCLEMERNISIPSGGSGISVKDTVHNLTPEAEPVFLLYHINFGFPFLNEGLVLEFPEGEVRGRTPFAQERINDRAKITPPIDGEPEAVYFYMAKEKDAKVTLHNRQLGLKAAVCYDSTRLPVLAQWKCMRSGDYALGIEPSTNFVRGRKEELADGYDVKVPPFGKLEFGFTVEFDAEI